MVNHLELWSTDAWRAEATAWIDARLGEHGLIRTGDVEQPHLRAWATVLRAPTSDGPVWLKAPGGGTAFEVPLYPLLLDAAPDAVLHPLAIERDRHWLLLPDGGTPLGELVRGADLVDALVRALPEYARLQRRLAAHVDDLIGIGVPDLRPSVIPARFRECLEQAAEHVADRGLVEEQATLQRLRDLEPTVRAWATELGRSAIPPSLDHNDLHPWNLLCADDDVTGARAYDWGDAVVGHPFATLMVALSWFGEDVDFRPDSPEVTRVRDAYLAEFEDLAPRADLLRELELGDRSARIGRALAWVGVLNATGERVGGELSEAPLRWLTTLLDAKD